MVEDTSSGLDGNNAGTMSRPEFQLRYTSSGGGRYIVTLLAMDVLWFPRLFPFVFYASAN